MAKRRHDPDEMHLGKFLINRFSQDNLAISYGPEDGINLTREEAQLLLPIIRHFAETGKLPKKRDVPGSE